MVVLAALYTRGSQTFQAGIPKRDEESGRQKSNLFILMPKYYNFNDTTEERGGILVFKSESVTSGNFGANNSV